VGLVGGLSACRLDRHGLREVINTQAVQIETRADRGPVGADRGVGTAVGFGLDDFLEAADFGPALPQARNAPYQ
jgi:hypothetical protein